MTELITAIQADLLAVATAMDTRKGGFPRAGMDVGGGAHVPAAQARTVQYGAVQKHPTLALWRYPWDAEVQAEVGNGLSIPASCTPTILDSGWLP